jgi:hypothetical protein
VTAKLSKVEADKNENPPSASDRLLVFRGMANRYPGCRKSMMGLILREAARIETHAAWDSLARRTISNLEWWTFCHTGDWWAGQRCTPFYLDTRVPSGFSDGFFPQPLNVQTQRGAGDWRRTL